jgi:hypothetical protein
VNSKEKNSKDLCLDFFQELGLSSSHLPGQQRLYTRIHTPKRLTEITQVSDPILKHPGGGGGGLKVGKMNITSWCMREGNIMYPCVLKMEYIRNLAEKLQR